MRTAVQPWRPPAFRWSEHVALGVLAAAIAPFTGLAWPFALLTGILVGQLQLAQWRPSRPSALVTGARIGAVGAGMVAMIVFGVVLGGLVAFAIAALAALAEVRATGGTARQQLGAKVLLVGLPALVWLLVFSGPPPG